MNVRDLLLLTGKLTKAEETDTGYLFHYEDGSIVEIRGHIESVKVTCLPDPDYGEDTQH